MPSVIVPRFIFESETMIDRRALLRTAISVPLLPLANVFDSVPDEPTTEYVSQVVDLGTQDPSKCLVLFCYQSGEVMRELYYVDGELVKTIDKRI